MLAGRERPANLGVLLREAFVALNNSVVARLAESGHGVVRAAHGAVFQYLDDTGTTVSLLAERAQMTKQAMAELVRHLEIHGYVERVPHSTDRRAKLVLPTDRGHDVIAIAQQFAPELETRIRRLLGPDRFQALCDDLQAIRRAVEATAPAVDLAEGPQRRPTSPAPATSCQKAPAR
ncbi:MAG TPA: MarR family transcriptional regulator [Pseudonocardiaceae bacterium]|jgi:DNA-binding MarR family transcriptional regulator|nr:MarR family transcriptional regulator [Pseudonocardiaceae bacterium]